MESLVREDIKPVRMTTHAIERMKLFGLAYKRLVYMLYHADDEKPLHLGKFKERKYNGNDGVKYLRFGPYVFTVINKPDKKTGRDITLVITLNDQRSTLQETKHTRLTEGGTWPKI